MSTPRVSVLMPAYNAERYIAEAVRSILDQTFCDFQLVVVDDGSSDNSTHLVRQCAEHDPRIILIRNGSSRNICNALNRGIEEARGEYVARMDADDWSYPDRLMQQVAFMDAHPDVVVSGGSIEICDGDLKPLNIRTYQQNDEDIRRRLFRHSPFAHPAVIYRTAAARAVGGYNPALADAEDYDFFLRLGSHGHFANLRDLLLRLRTSKDSVSQSKGRRQEHLTIYIRLKASTEYGYQMSGRDHLYTALQYASSFMIPPRMKFWLYNRLRARR